MHCSLPRVACSVCGATTQPSVPWAREGSRFTLMFEAVALTLAREMPVSACARIFRCADNTLWRQIDAHVSLARAQESYANVKVLGIDETSCAKDHSYITLVHDLDKARLIYATPGKDDPVSFPRTPSHAASWLRSFATGARHPSVEAPLPAFTDLFLSFFNLREGFSEALLYHYKRLLDAVGKAGSPQLVEPIIDLLRLEKHILGGDTAFMKKTFKTIGQLGSKADAAALPSRFDVAAETRPDVINAYHAAVARRAKKKA